MNHTNLNINIDKYGNHSVVPIRCGRNRGTAFFVETNQLLTATHIIGPHINNRTGCKIQVYVSDKWFDCNIAYQFDEPDVVLLNCEKEEPNGDKLKLVSSDCPDGEDLLVVGFPEEIGNGVDYFGINVRNSRHLRKDGKDDISRGFNVVVVRTDLLEFSSYSGFSGSPVLNEDGDVVGIATDQFYNTLGYTSIKMLVGETSFAKLGIPVDTSIIDTSQFGVTTAAKFLGNKVKYAGNRYSPETHIDNKSVNDSLSAFCHIGIEQKKCEVRDLCSYIYETCSRELREYIDRTIRDNETTAFKQFIDGGEINYLLLSDLEDIQYYKPEKSGICALINPLRKDVEKAFELVQGLLELETFENSQFLYVTGLAGQGKTHSLCRFADVNKNNSPFYLFYGTEFGDGEPIDRILELLGWENGDFERLNEYVGKKNQYAIFIIDAVNEGGGSEFWKTKIDALKAYIEQLPNIKLILSFRSMPETDELQSILIRGWEHIEIDGFQNTKDALEKHFKAAKINEDVANYIGLQEFQSPLYLKVFCEVYHMLPYSRNRNYTRDVIYDKYLAKRNVKISNDVDEDPTEYVTNRYVHDLANLSVEKGLCFDIPRENALDMANEMCKYRLWSHNLMNILIKESILKEYTLKNGRRFIGFEFDSIGDYLKMCYLKERSDELIIAYINNGLRVLSGKGMHTIERSHFSNVLSFLFSEWKPNEAVWRELIREVALRKSFMRSVAYRKDDEEYSKILTPIITDIIQKDSVYTSPEYLLDNFDTYKYGIINLVHDKLKSMPMHERDEKWTIAVNNLYDRSGIIARLNNLFLTQKNNGREVAILMSWFMSTSYPMLHAKLVKMLRNVFSNNLSLMKSTAEAFDNVDDPYIIQGIYAAMYATLVLNRDLFICKEVAEYIRGKYYSSKKDAPVDIVVRQWTLKIVELASILDVTYDGWNKVVDLMPFDSVENPFDGVDYNIVRDENYFGTTAGCKSINFSLFAWDFYRYILGTNNNIYSPVFADKKRAINDVGRLYKDGDVKIDDIADAIARIIHENYKYSNELGEYDRGVSHGDRYENSKERIGKKYQWLGYFEVLSYLCDHYKILMDRWSIDTRFASYPFPWFTGEIPRVDPNVDIEESLSVLSRDMFLPFAFDFKNIDDPKVWIKDIKQWPSIKFILNDMIDDDEWVVLHVFDTQDAFADNMRCSTTVWYHAMFVADADSQAFEKWCGQNKNFEQQFLASGEYEYHWNDYPHASAYKDLTHETFHDWTAPCKVNRATIIQLQEDFTGCYAPSEFIREVHAPCLEMMEQLNLHTAERGVIRDDQNRLVGININPTTQRMSGVVIKRDLLNTFLTEKGMKMYYFLTVQKTADMSYHYQYDPNVHHGVFKYAHESEPEEIVPMTLYVQEGPQHDESMNVSDLFDIIDGKGDAY